jgi:amino acid transporter
VAVATIGTQSYEAEGSIAPFAAMLSNALGRYGAIGTSVLAIIIIFGTVNVYTTGISRVIYATAREGGLPRFLDKVHARTQVPHRTLILLLGLSLFTVTLFYILNVDLATELKLLKTRGLKRSYPWISLGVSLIMIPFVGLLILVSLAFAVLGFFYQRTSNQ